MYEFIRVVSLYELLESREYLYLSYNGAIDGFKSFYCSQIAQLGTVMYVLYLLQEVESERLEQNLEGILQ